MIYESIRLDIKIPFRASSAPGRGGQCEAVRCGRRRFLKWAPFVLLGIIVLGLAGFAVLGLHIQQSARDQARQAMQEFPGDGVEALIAVVESDNHPLAERNRAVWALGQIGDPRALPVLDRYYTGEECRHDEFLCQHELRKAIALCKGKVNVITLSWRLFDGLLKVGEGGKSSSSKER